jgi:MoxR-like ATPase
VDFCNHLVRLLQHDGVVTISNMSDGVYEKDHIMAMSLLSAVAGENIFLLGPTETL